MDSKIQKLTETIFNEGLEKAKKESAVILEEAKKEAALIIEGAENEAKKLLFEAKKEAEEITVQTESEVRMRFEQALLALKQKITGLVTTDVINAPVNELFTNTDFLQKLILEIVKGWFEKESQDLKVIIPQSYRDQMESFFNNSLAQQFNKEVEVSFSQKFKSGFKIGPVDNSYIISFTDEDFINFLKGYLRPKTGNLLFGERQ